VSIILTLAEAIAPISVNQSGVTWGSFMISGTVVASTIAAITAYVKTRPLTQKNAIERDQSLRADLMAQLEKQDAETKSTVTRFEVRLDDQRKLYDEQRKLYEAKLEYKDILHQNEVKMMRHRMNNIDQCFTMLLTLIETSPDKAVEAARRVREMREKQEAQEVLETATIAAAATVAVTNRNGGGTPPPAPAPNPSTP
jgi:septal ring factor EnvC (AmiA/AmiB activator)